MKHDDLPHKPLSKRLKQVLAQLERVTIFDKNVKQTLPQDNNQNPQQCEESDEVR